MDSGKKYNNKQATSQGDNQEESDMQVNGHLNTPYEQY